MRLPVAATATLLLLALAGCQEAPPPADPLVLPSVPCEGQSSVIVDARMHFNFTHSVESMVQVKCAGEPVAGAHVEVRFWDGSVREIVTGSDGRGSNVSYWEEAPTGKTVRFRIVIDGDEMTQPAAVKGWGA